MGELSEVIVIGGGIVGCAAAAELAAEGVRVTLVERSGIAAGASGRNLGAIQHPFDAELASLHHDSLDRYRSLAADDAGFAIPRSPAGLLLLHRDGAAAARSAQRLAAVLPELRPAFLDDHDVAAAEPSLVEGLFAVRLDTGYPVPPAAATTAFARLAQAGGAVVRIGASAAPVVSAGRVVGAALDDGTRLGADAALVAAGPWTTGLVDPSGGWRPIHPTWGVTVQLRLGASAPRHILEEDEVDTVNRPAAAAARAAAEAGTDPPSLFSIASADGVSTLGSTFLPDEPDADSVVPLLRRRGAAFLPLIARATEVGRRVCARPQSFDGRPFIGPIPGVDGLFVCAGHGPWGISTGPGSAHLAVRAILDPRASIPSALSAARALPPA
ncbi:MAG: NAD(P)/FAD-dependent oxidoreductase [Candidatus Limnocylindria bacterium]